MLEYAISGGEISLHPNGDKSKLVVSFDNSSEQMSQQKRKPQNVQPQEFTPARRGKQSKSQAKTQPRQRQPRFEEETPKHNPDLIAALMHAKKAAKKLKATQRSISPTKFAKIMFNQPCEDSPFKRNKLDVEDESDDENVQQLE